MHALRLCLKVSLRGHTRDVYEHLDSVRYKWPSTCPVLRHCLGGTHSRSPLRGSSNLNLPGKRQYSVCVASYHDGDSVHEAGVAMEDDSVYEGMVMEGNLAYQRKVIESDSAEGPLDSSQRMSKAHKQRQL